MGFDKVDKHRDYVQIFENVNPSGESSIKEAYAYGIGTMLNFNRNYIYNCSLQASQYSEPLEIQNQIENIKTPKYLHFVIAADDEQQDLTCVSQNDINVL